MKKQVIHIGDQVKVIRCRFVRRVGYPLVWFDLKDEVVADPRTRQAWEILTGKLGSAFNNDFVEFVARLRVAERHFGGNERSLHYREVSSTMPEDELWGGISTGYSDKPVPDVTGDTYLVYHKRNVMTGTRWRHYDPEDGSYSGLKDRKTRVLLSIGPGEIEDCDVELVQKGTMHHVP